MLAIYRCQELKAQVLASKSNAVASMLSQVQKKEVADFAQVSQWIGQTANSALCTSRTGAPQNEESQRQKDKEKTKVVVEDIGIRPCVPTWSHVQMKVHVYMYLICLYV